MTYIGTHLLHQNKFQKNAKRPIARNFQPSLISGYEKHFTFQQETNLLMSFVRSGKTTFSIISELMMLFCSESSIVSADNGIPQLSLIFR